MFAELCLSGAALCLCTICVRMSVFRDVRKERKHLPCSLHVGRGGENVHYQSGHALRMN